MKGYLLVLAALLCASDGAVAQESKATPTRKKFPAPAEKSQKPKFKAIWEPVNYKEDLQLLDVFFADENEGWVTGAAGTILHTKDGGDTWTPQLGGDPKSREEAIQDLEFLDATHGWAVQHGGKLLRTADGENWEQVGPMAWQNQGDYYQFTSATNGISVRSSQIQQSLDAGRTWKDVFECRTKMEISGLIREVGCHLNSVHFPSATVGYAAGEFDLTGPFPLAKTTDGGATWTVWPVPAEVRALRVRFTDENTGFVQLYNYKIMATTDGGKNWHGLATEAREKIRFADHDVGWSFWPWHGQLTYTSDGGKRWFSRQFAFPAEVNAFSIPKRSRAYVVGDHGMIYRYRIVPYDYTSKGMLDAPMMSGAEPPPAK